MLRIVDSTTSIDFYTSSGMALGSFQVTCKLTPYSDIPKPKFYHQIVGFGWDLSEQLVIVTKYVHLFVF